MSKRIETTSLMGFNTGYYIKPNINKEGGYLSLFFEGPFNTTEMQLEREQILELRNALDKALDSEHIP